MQKERYNDKAQFEAKLKRALRLEDVSAGNAPASEANAPHIDLCWRLYQNARNNVNGKLVCGLLSDLRDARGELGPTNQWHAGSVLNIINKEGLPGKGWTTLANDCWVLGGIHAQLPFQLASYPDSATVKAPGFIHGKSKDSHMMRITARELLALTQFGYRRCINANIDNQSRAMGIKFEFRCFDKEKASQATIASYLKHVRQQAQVMLDHGAVPVREHIISSLGIKA